MLSHPTLQRQAILPAQPAPGIQDHRGGGFWHGAVIFIDGLLQSYYDIFEFTRDPDCLLRLGVSTASERTVLTDGTVVEAGEPIGTLHLWNEHLPPYGLSAGPDIAWATEMRRRLIESLRFLADHVEADPLWHEVKAFRGEAAFSSRLGPSQLQRVARRHGFDCIARESSSVRALRGLGICICTYGLAWAFNPAAISRQRFFRPYHELWISRGTLQTLYGVPRRLAAPRQADPAQRGPGSEPQRQAS
jgi:YkoP-like protein